MTIGIIEEIVAQKGREDEMGEFLSIVVRPRVVNSPGCVGCHIFRRQDDPARFVVVQQWRSAAEHKAYILAIPKEQLNHMRILLGSRESATLDLLE